MILVILLLLTPFLCYKCSSGSSGSSGYREYFVNPTLPPSQTCSQATLSLTDLGSNPLVDRDGNNVILNPSSRGKVNINIGSFGMGWSPVDSQNNLNINSSLVVNLGKLMKVNFIVTSGIKSFRAYFSRNDNTVDAYEEILHQNLEGEQRPNIFFETDTFESPAVKFGNLTTSDGLPVFARYVKIVPVLMDSAENNNNRASKNVISRARGVKVEILGLVGQARPLLSGESLLASSKLYDENGVMLLTGEEWTGERNNKNNQLKILFQDEDNKTIARKVNSIIFSSGESSNNQYVKEFSITYSHQKSNMKQTIHNIKGNTNCGDSNEFQFYFDTPIIATELVIRPTKLNIPTAPPKLKIVNILGSTISANYEKVLLDKDKKKFCTKDDPSGYGSVSDLLGKQSEIQQLCDAIDLQDKIKDNNSRIQKNRQYLMELEEHDKKIANLETIVEKMRHLRSIRQRANDHQLLQTKDEQSKIDTQLQTLIQDRKNNQKQINIRFNVDDNFKKNIEEGVSRLQSVNNQNQQGNNEDTTALEGFQNYDMIYINKQKQKQKQIRKQIRKHPRRVNCPFYNDTDIYYKPYLF